MAISTVVYVPWIKLRRQYVITVKKGIQVTDGVRQTVEKLVP